MFWIITCKSGVYYKGTKRTLKTLGVSERVGKEGTHLEGRTFSSKLGFRLHWRRDGLPHWVAENFIYWAGWESAHCSWAENALSGSTQEDAGGWKHRRSGSGAGCCLHQESCGEAATELEPVPSSPRECVWHCWSPCRRQEWKEGKQAHQNQEENTLPSAVPLQHPLLT